MLVLYSQPFLAIVKVWLLFENLGGGGGKPYTKAVKRNILVNF